ncbi:hypothetical protein QFZ45_004620 [Pseudomonas synxantha]|nr:hypothetical protein [Pseudomonas synxantha]
MTCEICLGLNEQFSEGHNLTWLNFGLQITSVPYAEISLQEQCFYRFLFESGLVWKIDHVDAYGDYWLCVQHDEHSYEMLAPVAGSFKKVPCDSPYPVTAHSPLHATTP